MKFYLAATLLIFSFNVNAAFLTGAKLLHMAEAADRVANGKPNETDGFEALQYLGYVMGAVDSYNMILFCLPLDVSALQSAAVVKKWLTANPEKWNLAGSAVIATALEKAFPCKK